MSYQSPMTDEVLALCRDIRRHKSGTLAAINALLAEFGISSVIGRAMSFSTLNTHMLYTLETLSSVQHLSLDEIHRRPAGELPSPVAQTMIDNSHERKGPRRVPMPPATRSAVVAYLDERITLLENTLSLCRREARDAALKIVRRELRAWRRVRAALERTG